MKKYSLIFGLLLIAALTPSCEDDFLDRPPLVGVTEDNFYRTADDAIAAVNAAYAALQFELTPLPVISVRHEAEVVAVGLGERVGAGVGKQIVANPTAGMGSQLQVRTLGGGRFGIEYLRFLTL